MKKITKGKNGENVSHLQMTKVVLVHCNVVTMNHDDLQDSRILYTFVANKILGKLLKTSPTNFIFTKTFKSEFQEIDVFFTDQNSQPLEIEDRINLTLIIK